MAEDGEVAACEVRLHADVDAFFAACSSDVLFACLAMSQIVIGRATEGTLEAVAAPEGLPKHRWEADEAPQVKQLFSFHDASGRACGAFVLSPGPPVPGKTEFSVVSAGKLETSLVAEALAMADPELVRRIGSAAGPAAACEAVADVIQQLQQRAHGCSRRGRKPGLTTIAMEQDAGVVQDLSALPAGRLRRVMPVKQDDVLREPQSQSLCEDATLADDALLETLTDWHVGFMHDALSMAHPREKSRKIVEGLLAKGSLYAWEVEGEGLVTLACCGRWLADVGCSLTLVYAPPEHRRRGYAQALLVAMGAALTRVGRRICLFADNDGQHGALQMYEKLGYIRQGMHHQIKFPEEEEGVGTT